MNWDAIGAIGEVVGAAAVVASLVYLATQIRKDAQAKRAATIHNQSQSFSNFLRVIATNPEVADIWLAGTRDFESLDDQQRLQFSTLAGDLFRLFEDNFLQWRDGAFKRQSWTGPAKIVVDILALPGIRTWWETRSHWYSREFQVFVQGKLDEGSERAA